MATNQPTFDSKTEAIRAVFAMQAEGNTDITTDNIDMRFNEHGNAEYFLRE